MNTGSIHPLRWTGAYHEREMRPWTIRLLTAHRLQMLVLDRSDPALNIARFYVLAIEPTLFGDTALVREWGRRGQQGHKRLDLYDNADLAREALEDWLQKKVWRGYRQRVFGEGLSPSSLCDGQG